MSDRDVLFRIGLADHPETGNKLDALANAVNATMERIEASITRVGNTAAEQADRIRTESNRITQYAPAPAGPAAQPRFSTASGPQYAPAPQVTTIGGSYESHLARIGGASLSTPAQNPYSPPANPFTPPPSMFEQTLGQPSTSPNRPPQVGLGLPETMGTGSSGSNGSSQRGRDDAKRYESEFRGALAQMTSLSDDEMNILVGTEQKRWETIGKENGDQYRKGLRDSMSQSLGLSGDQANELFGAKGGAEGLKQQAEYQKGTTDLIESIQRASEQYNKLDAESAKVSESMSKSFQGLSRGSGELGEGIGRVATGLAFLGAKNESVQAVINTLLTIKGASDIFTGVTKTISTTVEMVSLFGERQKSAARLSELNAQKTELARTAAAQYVQVLQRENVSIDEATRGNRQHAQALQQIAIEADRAARAEREFATAANMASNAGNGVGRGVGIGPVATAPGRGMRGGRAAGFAGAVGTAIGFEALQSLGVGGIAGDVANIGMDYAADSMMDRMMSGGVTAGAGGAAGGAARGGLIQRAGQMTGNAGRFVSANAGRFAGAAGRTALATGSAAAAIGTVYAAGQGVYDVAGGLINEGQFKFREGSTSQRFMAGLSDSAGYLDSKLGLDTEAGNAYKQRGKLDKQIAEMRAKEERDARQNSLTGILQSSSMRADYQLRDMDREARERSSFTGGKENLLSMTLMRQNTAAELQREQSQLSTLGMDQSFGGQRKVADSEAKIQELKMQLQQTDAGISQISMSGGIDPKEQAEQRRASLAKELAATMREIDQLGKDTTKNAAQYATAVERAAELGDRLKQSEGEVLAILQDQKKQKQQANEIAMQNATARLGQARNDRETAQGGLESAAERFASMSKGDQLRAKNAMELVNQGRAEEMSDSQRSALGRVGTIDAMAGVKKANLAEARNAGFFQNFGRTEQMQMAQAANVERQMKVELANRNEISVKLETDNQKTAAIVRSEFKALYAEQQKSLQAMIRDELLKAQREATRAAQAEQMKGAGGKKTY